jgi:hypothetical protein
MAINKLLNNLQWKTVATVSNPDSGYKILFAKSEDKYLYLVDEQGNQKRIGLSIYLNNGLRETSLPANSLWDYQLDVAIGTGLTFSANTPGSTINVVGLTAYSLGNGSFTDGYILGATSGGNLQWVPYPSVNANGITNYISKFTGTNTISNSLVQDDGSIVYIGSVPGLGVSFSVSGDVNLGKIYF